MRRPLRGASRPWQSGGQYGRVRGRAQDQQADRARHGGGRGGGCSANVEAGLPRGQRGRGRFVHLGRFCASVGEWFRFASGAYRASARRRPPHQFMSNAPQMTPYPVIPSFAELRVASRGGLDRAGIGHFIRDCRDIHPRCVAGQAPQRRASMEPCTYVVNNADLRCAIQVL